MKLSKKLNLFWKFILYKLNIRATPLWVNFRITNKCNCKCSYCTLYKRKMKELSTEEIKKAVNEMKDETLVLFFTGGEPLLHPDIEELVDYAKNEAGIYYLALFSNGKIIPEKIDIVKKADLLVISVDAPKEENDKNRGKGSYDAAVKAIEVATKNGIKVATESVVTKNNVKTLPLLFKELKKYNLAAHFFNIVTEYDNSGSTSDIAPSQEEVKALIKVIKKQRDEGCPVVNSDYVLKRYENYPNRFKKATCKSGMFYCNIDTDGKVSHCPFHETQGKYFCNKDGFMKAFKKLEKWKPSETCKRCYINFEHELNNLSIFNIKDIRRWISFMKDK